MRRPKPVCVVFEFLENSVVKHCSIERRSLKIGLISKGRVEWKIAFVSSSLLSAFDQ